MEIWHKRIQALRENSDVTLKDMALIIGVSEATIQRYESGKIYEIPYKAIIAYAEKFNCSPSYIMGWTDSFDKTSLTSQDMKLLKNYHSLDRYGKKAVDDTISRELERCRDQDREKEEGIS